MSVSESALGSGPRNARQVALGVAIVALITIVGLFIVKWSPYWHKAFTASATHTLGSSIVSGKGVQPQSIGIAAAWTYTLAYFKAVWEAVVLALLLGAAVQAFLPRRRLVQLLGRPQAGPVAVATAGSMVTMMCTCCTAPIVVGLRRARAAAGSALAFFLGNPVLNPATLIFIGFVLGWRFAVLRAGVGAALVLGVGVLGNRFDRFAQVAAPVPDDTAQEESEPRGLGGMVSAFARELWVEIRTILPGYIAIVFVIGGLRAWLFPPGLELHAAGPLAIAGLAALGTLFVIPTAGEVPIIQTLLHAGMGNGPAAALLMTLPAVSLPSLYIVRNVFPKRVLAWTAGCVFLAGLAAGAIAYFAF